MGQFRRTSPATVLVVESEALVRLEFTDWLADEGFIALGAGNADEAVALLDAHPEIDVMMTDIAMSGSMDGARLAHHVRDRWPPVKIVVVSGLPQNHCAALPTDALFLPKPVHRNDLLTRLAGLLGTSRDHNVA